MLPEGMTLPGNGVRIALPLTIVVVEGSKMLIRVPEALNVCEKSPRRCKSVGTVRVRVEPARSRWPS